MQILLSNLKSDIVFTGGDTKLWAVSVINNILMFYEWLLIILSWSYSG